MPTTWQAAGNAVMLSKAKQEHRATALCSLQGRQECLPYLMPALPECLSATEAVAVCVFRRIAPAQKIDRSLLCRGG